MKKQDILNLILTAARALNDSKVAAWALHQLGSRALYLGYASEAKTFLSQALNIRQTIGDKAGAAITQHNINTLNGIIAPQKGTTSGCRKYLGCGCGGAVGLAILAAMVWVGFNEKIAVDFARDDKNNIIFESGKPTYKEEFVSDWSVKRLKDLFYEGRLNLPLDHRLDIKLNSVISMVSGTRTVYECMAEEDHLLASFRVFSSAQWLTEFLNLRPNSGKKWFKSGV